MPNIGPLEVAIVAIIALIIFGPKRLPELGKSLGDGMREFKASISGENDDEDDDDEDDLPQLENGVEDDDDEGETAEEDVDEDVDESAAEPESVNPTAEPAEPAERTSS